MREWGHYLLILVSSSLDYCNSLLYGIVDTDVAKLQRIQNCLTCIVTKSPLFTRSVALLRSLHWLPVTFGILFKISLLIYKTLLENGLFIFTLCLPHHSHPINWDQWKVLVCQSRPTQVQEVFTLVCHLFGTTCCCLSIHPFQLPSSRNSWRHISLTWSFPHRHQHTWWPVDVTELLHRFCCSTTDPDYTMHIGVSPLSNKRYCTPSSVL